MPRQELVTRSPLKQTIGANIDRAIRDSGLTNRQVGDRIGVAEGQVWRWRRGRVEPTGVHRIAVADVLFGGDLGAMYAEVDG